MTKFLDSDGLEYLLERLSPMNGDLTIVVPLAAYTASSSAMKNLIMGGMSVNNQLANVTKKKFSCLLFYTASSAGFVIGNDSKYIGSGYYCGNGADALANSYGTILAYMFPSNGGSYDMSINNVKGTLS